MERRVPPFPQISGIYPYDLTFKPDGCRTGKNHFDSIIIWGDCQQIKYIIGIFRRKAPAADMCHTAEIDPRQVTPVSAVAAACRAATIRN